MHTKRAHQGARLGACSRAHVLPRVRTVLGARAPGCASLGVRAYLGVCCNGHIALGARYWAQDVLVWEVHTRCTLCVVQVCTLRHALLGVLLDCTCLRGTRLLEMHALLGMGCTRLECVRFSVHTPQRQGACSSVRVLRCAFGLRVPGRRARTGNALASGCEIRSFGRRLLLGAQARTSRCVPPQVYSLVCSPRRRRLALLFQLIVPFFQCLQL